MVSVDCYRVHLSLVLQLIIKYDHWCMYVPCFPIHNYFNHALFNNAFSDVLRQYYAVIIRDTLILPSRKIGKQKERAKCWHNRSKFKQNALN